MGTTNRYILYADAIDHLVLECGANGYSRAQTAACIGVSKKRLAMWAKEHPRLADILDRADTLAQAWWEGRAMDGVANQRIGGTVWHKSVAARFPDDYADRQEIGNMGDAARIKEVKWKVVRPNEESEE